GKVYEISINNKDRFVISAPSGDQVADGDQFTITDENGGVVYYEFDSGYRLQVPQGLTLQIPLAGGAFGGIVDGDRFTLTVGSASTTFEFDRNNNVLAGNRAIQFQLGASQQEILDAVIAAIGAANLSGISPAQLSPGEIFIGAEAGVQLNTTFSTLTQPNGTLALRIPDVGPRGGVLDGHTFTLNDGRQTLTFEYDTNGTVATGHVAIDFSTAISAADIAQQTQAAIATSKLNFQPTVVAGTLVHLGMGPSGSASIDNSKLTIVGVARTLADGEKFTITGNGKSVTFELTRDATVATGNVAIMVAASDTQSVIADRIVAAIAAADLGLTPHAVGPGNIAIGGTSDNTIDASAAPGLTLFGKPGVQSKTRLQVFGPLLIQLPAINALADNSTLALQGNGKTVVFEFDGNGSGPSAVGNVVIPFTALSSQTDVGIALATAITGAGLNITASSLGNGRVSLGQINANQVLVGTSGVTVVPSVVSDGETFTISNGLLAVTFEFNNVDLNNGFNPSNTQIQFSDTTSPATLIASMKAAIEAAGLGLTTTVLADATLELNDTPRYLTDVSGAPTLVKTGVPGGANPVQFIQDSNFTGADLKRAIIAAINASPNTNLVASDRGDNTLFVSGATVISPEIDSFFLRGVADLAGNLLKPNQINNETKFTILMPGVTLDYGDAPDPLGNISGRYPTLKANDGARHVVGSVALLGSGISVDVDGQPKPGADGDTFDDGVVFGSLLAIPGYFNRNVETPVTVTLSTAGFVDAWIDFNADGDWDDPGEKVLSSAQFTAGNLTQTFMVTVPSTAPNLAVNTRTFARFRSSSVGGLIPTGLAVDGEVEDYAVTLVPGNPPTAVDDTYVFNEDPLLPFTTTDPSGTVTPGFTIDDGVAANDTDPDGGILKVTLVTGPQSAQPGSFQLNANGTFSYRPLANFNGQDTFVYRVNDGVLGSNNLGTATLTVREVNDAPIPGADAIALKEGQKLTIPQADLLANDVAGPANEAVQTLNITAVSATSIKGGTLTLVGGVITYTPPANYSGADSFTYTVTDNGTTAGAAAPLSAVGTVNLQISDQNNPPIPVGKSLAAVEDTPATITAAQLLVGDKPGPADESSQTLTVIGVTAASTEGGTVTFTAGVANYTPAADFEGTDT
ncbi:MAG: cadherin-like domain-containing protein, partial [Aureliella sp.]